MCTHVHTYGWYLLKEGDNDGWFINGCETDRPQAQLKKRNQGDPYLKARMPGCQAARMRSMYPYGKLGST